MLPSGRTPTGHVAFAPVHVAPLHSLCFHATGQPHAQRTYSGKKDDCELPVAQRLLDKDASRPRKKASGGQVLALLRGAILRLHDAEAFESLNAGFHHHSAKPHAALRLLKTSPPKIS